MILTAAHLQAGCGASAANAAAWLAPVQAACDTHSIATPLRVAAFLATIGVESAYLTAAEENLNYSATALAISWPDTFAVGGHPNSLALSIARNPQAIANNAYANKNGNGEVASGDGWKYRGRGLIQVTFFNNYASLAPFIDADILNNPDSLSLPSNAAMGSARYWDANGLNAMADQQAITAISKYVNCGSATSSRTPNAMPQRLALYSAARKSLGC